MAWQLLITVSGTTFHITTMENDMFHWALTFLILAFVASVFGMGAVAGTSIQIAQILFGVGLLLLLIGTFSGRIEPLDRI